MTAPYLYPFGELTADLTVAYDYDANSNLIYQGWTQPGNSKLNTGWRIMHQVFNAQNKVTDLLWPRDAGGNISTAFNFVWGLRTSYDYGLGASTSVFAAFILTSPNTTRWAITVNTVGDLVSTPQASGPPNSYDMGSLVLQDSSLSFWNVTIQNTGNLVTTIGGNPIGALISISLTDSNGKIWVVTVDTTGHLVTT